MMSKKSLCIKIRKIHGGKAIIAANNFEIIDKELEIQKNTDFIYVPLLREPVEDELAALNKQAPDFQVLTCSFPERKKCVKTFVELLEDKLPPYLLASLPRAIDIVGDIAIIEVPPELNVHKALVGKAILEAHKNLRTVLAKAGAIGGTYRVREFDIIAGEPRTDTVHKEHGCQYYVDLAKAYFSPRLSYEHKRVASLVQEGETVVDLFAGVGPFAVLIAKNTQNVRVYAVDVNPDAFESLKRNVKLNRVENRVFPLIGEAKRVVEDRLVGVADRVIMNLPEKAIEFIDTACEAIKPSGGIVHFYSFISVSSSLENMQYRFVEAVEKTGRKVERILFSKTVRATAPHEWQSVFDAKIH